MAGKIFPLTPHLTLIGKNLILDKRYGSIMKINFLANNSKDPVTNGVIQEILTYLNKSNIVIQDLNQAADVVVGIDSLDIDFYLKTSDGIIESKAGFLIEVFESGSNGKLTKLYKEDLKDPVDDNKIVEDGFSNYFDLKIDPKG